MASPLPSSLFIKLLSLTSLIFSLLLIQSAPTPTPSAPMNNITAILEKSNKYTIFIRLLKETQIGPQMNNQVKSIYGGFTIFAPTDNAFTNLPPGTLNSLTLHEHVQLVLYHITAHYYSLESLNTVSNPVRTQASGQDGTVLGLYFYGKGNNVNVSTGIVDVPIYNIPVWSDFPNLVVYQVDKVLLHREFYGGNKAATASSPVSPPSPRRKSNGGPARSPAVGSPENGSGRMKGPSKAPASSPAYPPSGGGGLGGAARAPVIGNPGNGCGRMNLGFGWMTAIGLCMGLFL